MVRLGYACLFLGVDLLVCVGLFPLLLGGWLSRLPLGVSRSSPFDISNCDINVPVFGALILDNVRREEKKSNV